MKNKRILVVPVIVLYVLWLVLIPIIFHDIYWEKLEVSAIAWLYLMSTAGVWAVGCCIYIIALVGIRIISGLIEWIKKGIPEEEPDEFLEEAEKETDIFLEENK